MAALCESNLTEATRRAKRILGDQVTGNVLWGAGHSALRTGKAAFMEMCHNAWWRLNRKGSSDATACGVAASSSSAVTAAQCSDGDMCVAAVQPSSSQLKQISEQFSVS